MLFFEVGFLTEFLIPLLLICGVLCILSATWLLPWIGCAASIYFLYDFDYGTSTLIALLSILINYIGAKYLLEKKNKAAIATIIFVNLAVLAYFKYSVLIENSFFGYGLTWAWQALLPLGISFYTFQQIAFVSDVYRGKVTSFSFRSYALFKLFFPQFIAGPIVHFERVRSSYERWPTFNARSWRFGLSIFAIGMFKKLIGDYFGAVANPYFATQASMEGYAAWMGMLAFSLQIYFDFSGYSDMAVGLARLFGVSLPFNFRSPYKATSPSDFWRRWHITLSQWLRDYLYISLGGNRHGTARMLAALFVTMSLGGLWHGASWTFAAWGAVHGIALIAARLVKVPVPPVVGRATFLIFIALTWVLFRSESFAGAWAHYMALLDPTPGFGIEMRRVINIAWPFLDSGAGTASNRPEQVGEVFGVIGAITWCLLLPSSQQVALWGAGRRIDAWKGIELPILCAMIICLSLAFISPDKSNAFIYFEF